MLQELCYILKSFIKEKLYLAKIISFALCNGSLTHIEMVYKQLKYLCFYITFTDSGSSKM